jgi:putative PIN family toxin of toxin-antitoxin system
MIRVVLDTNVVVSALLSPAGFEDRALRLALHGHVQLYVSSPILNEYGRVLSSPKLASAKYAFTVLFCVFGIVHIMCALFGR